MNSAPSPRGPTRTWVDKSIASQDNAVFRSLLECLTTKGVKKHGLFISSGEKVVSEILERHPAKVRDLIVCTELHLDVSGRDPQPKLNSVERMITKLREISGGPSQSRPAVIALSKALFDQLDTFGTHQPLLALSAWEIPQADLTKEPRGLEILCALSDPSNLGAVLRSTAAFSATKVILLKESASPFHPKAIRAASAATFTTKLEKGPSISELASSPAASSLIGLDMEGQSLNQFQWPTDVRLLLGEEGRGLPAREHFKTIAIPIAADVESLNATVAASIACYSYRAQFPK